MAKKWADLGAQYLHVVDLDGAFDGESPNWTIIEGIASAVSVPIQVGGGIRSMEKIRRMLDDFRIARVILGTAALKDPELVQAAARRYPGRVAAGIDAKGGKAAVSGWVEETDVDAVSLGRRMKGFGMDTCIYTDIAKDGMLQGPNLAETKVMIEQTGLSVIASGGISSLEDLQAVKAIGAAGVIIGRALYTGDILLADALRL
jgi:phosphoribosylformimino-5-aminoimidazole carboxamide ribotide isomerase